MFQISKRRIHFMGLATLVIGFVTLGSDNDASASDVSKGWKTECVGRYQISLPGDVEVALVNRNDFLSDMYPIESRFNDGVLASSSAISVNGTIFVSQLKQAEELSSIQREVDKANENLIEEFRKDGFPKVADKIKPISPLPDGMFGWIATGLPEQVVNLFVGRKDYIYRYKEVGAKVRPGGMRFVKYFRPRALYEIPKEPGVCFPYGFIADDGKTPRHVGVTMRLKEYPDVRIFFEDYSASADEQSEHFDPQFRKASPKALELSELKYLWQEEAAPIKRTDVSPLDFHVAYVDGHKGTGSSIEITRLDGGKDYGYAAVVAGKYVHGADAPRLKVYVIRTAAWAKDTPMSNDELKGIAAKIVASIKRREVK